MRRTRGPIGLGLWESAVGIMSSCECDNSTIGDDRLYASIEQTGVNWRISLSDGVNRLPHSLTHSVSGSSPLCLSLFIHVSLCHSLTHTLTNS